MWKRNGWSRRCRPCTLWPMTESAPTGNGHRPAAEPAARRISTLVLGGGPAGASAAIRLVKAGRPVELWERDLMPGNRNNGDFLGHAALLYLNDLGIDLAMLGAAPIQRLRMVQGRHVANMRLGFQAMGLTRRLLDTALLQQAEAAGVVVRRGVAARAFDPSGMVETAGDRAMAERLLLATGWPLGPASISEPPHMLGFRSYFRLSPAARAELTGHLELAVLPQGRAILHAVEREGASLSILVNAGEFARLEGRFEALLQILATEAPPIGERLLAAVPLLDRPVAIAQRLPRPLRQDRSCRAIWDLGDLATAIPGFPGDGIGHALHGARVASAAILTGADQLQYARSLRRDLAWPQRASALVEKMARDPAWWRRAAGFGFWLPMLAPSLLAVARLRPGAIRRARLL